VRVVVGSALVAFAAAVAGCAQDSWSPADPHLKAAPTAMHVDLARRMPTGPYRSVYRRTSRKHPELSPQRYAVVALPGIQREGAFADSDITTLADMVPGGDEPAHPEHFTWPPWGHDASGMMLRFDPPIDYLPRRLVAQSPEESSARLEIFNPKGEPSFTGKATRRVTLEGFATVTAGGRRYTDCVCVRTETRIDIPLTARVALTEYLYIAPTRGVVRRVRRLRGLVLIRYFDDVVEDELVGFERLAPADAERAAPTWTAGAWSAAVVFFQPSMPQPYVAGALFGMSPAGGEAGAPRPATDGGS